MTTTPALINPKYSGDTWGSFQYKLKSETSTYATYDRWDGTNYLNNEIKVGVDSTHADFNKWSDADSATHPYDVSRDGLPDTSGTGGTIELVTSGGSNYFRFDKPVLGSSGSSGPGTLSVSYSGSLTVNGTSLEYEIPSTASSGTYMLMSSISSTPQLNIVHGSTESTGSAPNFDQTKIWTLLSPLEEELARIDLTSSKRKVSCNFW